MSGGTSRRVSPGTGERLNRLSTSATRPEYGSVTVSGSAQNEGAPPIVSPMKTASGTRRSSCSASVEPAENVSRPTNTTSGTCWSTRNAQELAEAAGLASPVVPQIEHDAIDGVTAHRFADGGDHAAAVFQHDLVPDVERPLRWQVVDAERRLRVPEEVESRAFGQQQLPAADPVRVRRRVHRLDRRGTPLAVRSLDVERHRVGVVG